MIITPPFGRVHVILSTEIEHVGAVKGLISDRLAIWHDGTDSASPTTLSVPLGWPLAIAIRSIAGASVGQPGDAGYQ